MIRITAHSTDPAFLVLRIDREHNRVIGSFEPARRQDDMGIGIYVMEADRLNSLQSWARYQQIHLLNEVRDKAEPTRAIECGNIAATWTTNDGRRVDEPCSAPYPAGRIPKFCGACGQPAKPVIFADDEPTSGARCSGCGRVNRGGPAHCIGCGEPLPDRHLSVPAIRRAKTEPVPLGAAIGELSMPDGPR